MAEMAGQGEIAGQNLKFDCPEGLIVLGQVKYYDYIENDEFMRNTKDENGVCVNITIYVICDKARRLLDEINEKEEKPYLWRTYHLYTPKRPQDKLEGKTRLTCIGYLKGKG